MGTNQATTAGKVTHTRLIRPANSLADEPESSQAEAQQQCPLSQMNYHLTGAADPRVEIGKGLLNASPIRVSSAATVPTKQHKSGLTAKNLPLDLTPVVHGPPVPAGT